MANDHTSDCATSLVRSEHELKPPWFPAPHTPEWLTRRGLTTPSVGEAMAECELTLGAGKVGTIGVHCGDAARESR